MKFFCKKNVLNLIYAIILWPFSIIYYTVFLIIKLFTKKYKINNSIVVGNITVGGTGKTPIVIYLTQKFQQSAIITRGYKGKFSGFARIKDWEKLSDETRLYLKQCDTPIIVGKNRIKWIKKYKQMLKDRILIFDDALQYFPLIPNIKICVLDSQCPFGNDFLIPAGILREPKYLINHYDVCLIKGNNIKNINQIIKIPHFVFYYKNIGIFDHHFVKQNIEDKDIYALSAIGNPLNFENSLKEMGFNIKKHFVFPDHHIYTKRDLDNLPTNLPIITTEKDIVKIPKEYKNIYFLRIKVKIENEFEFLNLVRSKIEDYYH